jgi:hypothetical protein
MIHTGPIRFEVCVEPDCDGECEVDCATQETQFSSLDAAIADGNWWECHNCGRNVDDSGDEDGDEDLPELDPVCTVYKGGNRVCRVFCTPACHDEAMAQKEAARNEKDR